MTKFIVSLMAMMVSTIAMAHEGHHHVEGAMSYAIHSFSAYELVAAVTTVMLAGIAKKSTGNSRKLAIVSASLVAITGIAI